MTGFDPKWLALREPSDLRARSERLIARAAKVLDGRVAPVVCDLGAGTGSAARAFTPHFPASVRWLLVDGDADCLKVAEAAADHATEIRVADLSSTPDPWTDETVLVTASALFDLASAAWIDNFAARLARDGLPLLACLTFDGQIDFDPPDPDDDRMRTAFLLHQLQEKGLGGPACGPQAGKVLSDALTRHGFHVEMENTPWELSIEADRPLIEALVSGYGRAAAETGEVRHREAAAWAARRVSTIAALTVGHVDIFATKETIRRS